MEFDAGDFDFDYFLLAKKQHVSHWIMDAVRLNVQVFRLSFAELESFCLPDLPLVSQHLVRLELACVDANDSILDFSGCPSLLVLRMKYCFLNAGKLMISASLKKLIMIDCEFRRGERTRVSLPSLISLELTRCYGRTPLLECIPSLERAIVSLADSSEDYCIDGGTGDCGDDSCEGCKYYYGSDDNRNDCVFLKGLSEATHVELSACPSVVCLQLHSHLPPIAISVLISCEVNSSINNALSIEFTEKRYANVCYTLFIIQTIILVIQSKLLVLVLRRF